MGDWSEDHFKRFVDGNGYNISVTTGLTTLPSCSRDAGNLDATGYVLDSLDRVDESGGLVRSISSITNAIADAGLRCGKDMFKGPCKYSSAVKSLQLYL